MAFDIELSARFSALFQDLNQVVDILKNVQSTARQVSATIEADFKKSAAGTQQFNNSFKAVGTLLSQLNNNLSSLGGISQQLEASGKSAENLTINVRGSIDAVNQLADAAILEAAVFKDKSDEKQLALQHEVDILKELQAAAAKYSQLQDNANKFTQEIILQTQKVQQLTTEIKGIALPEQQADPFVKATTGVVSLRTQIINARNDADRAALTYGEWSPQFAAAAQKLAILQERLNQINKTALAFSPEAKLAGINTVLRGLFGGFTGFQGLLAFVGNTGEDVARSLQKVQGLLLATSGINEVLSLGTGLKALALQLGITKTATAAMAVEQGHSTLETVEAGVATAAYTSELTKFGTGAKDAQSVLDKLGVTKAADATISKKQVVTTEASAVAQGEDAAATAANARAKTLLTGASNLVAGAEAKAAVGAEVNAAAQVTSTIATEGSAVAAGTASTAFSELFAIMLANPITAIFALIAAIAGAMLIFADNTDEAIQKQAELNDQQKNNFDILNKLDEILNKSSKERLDALDRELKLSQARDDASVITLEKEVELAGKRAELAQRSISLLDLSKKRIGELQAEFESAITRLDTFNLLLSQDPKNDDLKKRVEAQKGVVDNLETQLNRGEQLWKDYNDSVTDQAVKTAQLLKQANEDVFNSLKSQAAARVTLAKVGTNERVKAEIAAAEIETKTEQQLLLNKIKSINKEIAFRKEQGTTVTREQSIAEINQKAALNSEIEKLDAELQVNITRINTEAAIRRINEQKLLDQANLVSIQKSSEAELDLKLNIIQETARAEVLSLDKTAKEKTAILLQAENEQNELRKSFFANQIKEQIEIERSAVATELNIVQSGSLQELKIKKTLVDEDQRLQIRNAIDTITNTKLLEQKIKEIVSGSTKAKDDLDKAFQKARLERAAAAAQQIIKLENIALQAQADNPLSNDSEQLQANRKILINDQALIQNKLDLLNLLHTQGLISETDYQDALNQLQLEGAQNTIDIEKNKAAALQNSLKQTITFVKSLFPDLTAETQSAIDQLGAAILKIADDFRKGTLSFADAIATINGLVSVTNSLISAQVVAQEQALNLQIQDNDQFLSNIDAQIQAKVDQINQEQDLNAKNVANNLKLRQDELTILNKQKLDALNQDKKLKEEKVKLEKDKAAVEAVSQASALLLAAANILASFSVIPFGVGIAIAGGVIAGMYAIFSSFQGKVKAATSGGGASILEKGGPIKIGSSSHDHGIVKGKRHTQGGHRIEGTNIFVEDGEMVNNRMATRLYNHWLMGANENNFGHITWKDIVSLPGISFPHMEKMNPVQGNTIRTKSVEHFTDSKRELKVLQVTHSGSFTTIKLEGKMEQVRKELQDFKKKFITKPERHILPGDGEYKIMTIDENVTSIVKKV